MTNYVILSLFLGNMLHNLQEVFLKEAKRLQKLASIEISKLEMGASSPDPHPASAASKQLPGRTQDFSERHSRRYCHES